MLFVRSLLKQRTYEGNAMDYKAQIFMGLCENLREVNVVVNDLHAYN